MWKTNFLYLPYICIRVTPRLEVSSDALPFALASLGAECTYNTSWDSWGSRTGCKAAVEPHSSVEAWSFFRYRVSENFPASGGLHVQRMPESECRRQPPGPHFILMKNLIQNSFWPTWHSQCELRPKDVGNGSNALLTLGTRPTSVWHPFQKDLCFNGRCLFSVVSIDLGALGHV